MTKLFARPVPRGAQKRKALNDSLEGIDWPVSVGFVKMKDPKNRTAVSSKVFIVSIRHGWGRIHLCVIFG